MSDDPAPRTSTLPGAPQPPPDDASTDALVKWLVKATTRAHERIDMVSEELRALVRAVGTEPRTAEGVKGSGLLASLSTVLAQRDAEHLRAEAVAQALEIRQQTRRSVLTGASLALGVVVALMTIGGAVWTLIVRH